MNAAIPSWFADPLSCAGSGTVVALSQSLHAWWHSSLRRYALTFPQLTGRVVDEAGILDERHQGGHRAQARRVRSQDHRPARGRDLKSLQGTSIEDYGYQLGRHWGIGQKEKNSGALLIVVPAERKVRIEVGYGLRRQLTDAVSKLIIENSIVPRFRAGDFADGINRGVDDIIQVLTVDPEEWKQRAKQRPDSQPGTMDIVVVILLLVRCFHDPPQRHAGSARPRKPRTPRIRFRAGAGAVGVRLGLVGFVLVGVVRRRVRRWWVQWRRRQLWRRRRVRELVTDDFGKPT